MMFFDDFWPGCVTLMINLLFAIVIDCLTVLMMGAELYIWVLE